MKVTWEIDDGYCGGSRPHVVYVDDDELNECETEEEREELISSYIQESFNENITWSEIDREDG